MVIFAIATAFFFSAVGIPMFLGYVIFSSSMEYGVIMLLAVFCAAIVGYVFRRRTHGRAYVVSIWSFDNPFGLALSAAFAPFSGASIFDGSYGVAFLCAVISLAFAIWSLSDGPTYGWNDSL